MDNCCYAYVAHDTLHNENIITLQTGFFVTIWTVHFQIFICTKRVLYNYDYPHQHYTVWLSLRIMFRNYPPSDRDRQIKEAMTTSWKRYFTTAMETAWRFYFTTAMSYHWSRYFTISWQHIKKVHGHVILQCNGNVVEVLFYNDRTTPWLLSFTIVMTTSWKCYLIMALQRHEDAILQWPWERH
jgi:hypothetical protein